MSEDIQRFHATVHGRVQGVGFRNFIMQQAHALNLTGWLRNRFDRTVEVAAEGPRPALDQFLSQLRRGPSASNVTQVDFEWLEAAGEFTRFKVRMTS